MEDDLKRRLAEKEDEIKERWQNGRQTRAEWTWKEENIDEKCPK